jgi:hypothetical protein
MFSGQANIEIRCVGEEPEGLRLGRSGRTGSGRDGNRPGVAGRLRCVRDSESQSGSERVDQLCDGESWGGATKRKPLTPIQSDNSHMVVCAQCIALRAKQHPTQRGGAMVERGERSGRSGKIIKIRCLRD